MSDMRYRTFLFWNAIGGIVWGIGFTLAGYFAGNAYERVISAAGTASTVVIVVVAVAIVSLVVWRKVREHRRTAAAGKPRIGPDEPTEGP
jgi:membrane protein DedA with SNARE-associated domain